MLGDLGQALQCMRQVPFHRRFLCDQRKLAGGAMHLVPNAENAQND
jgi:hypothetical protein